MPRRSVDIGCLDARPLEASGKQKRQPFGLKRVDLATVNGSGARGRIVKDDVKSFVKRTLATPTASGLAIAPMEAVDFSRFGEIEVVPLSRIRARGAANLLRSSQHVVHVTQHDDFDVTDLEAFRASPKDEAAAAGVKLSRCRSS